MENSTKIEFDAEGNLKIPEALKRVNKPRRVEKKKKEDIVSEFNVHIELSNNGKEREEHSIILDFLPHGYPSDSRPKHMKTPIAQAVGTNHLTLLEVVPKKGIILQQGKKVYMGNGPRQDIHHVIGKINFGKLTEKARNNIKSGLARQNKEKIIIALASEKSPKDFKIVDTFYSHGKKVILCNTLPKNSKYIEEFFKKIFNQDIEMRSQLGMLREESRIKGRNFHI